MKSIGEQAREFRLWKGWKPAEMAAAISRHHGKAVSRQSVEQLEAVGNRRPQYITALAKVMKTTVEALERGEWEISMFPINGQNDQGAVTYIQPSKFKIAWVVGKGSGGTMPERIWTDGDYPVGATDEYAEVASTDERAFLIEVVGNSMSPRYMPGEFCLVEPATEPEIEDDVLVRLKDGQTLLKRLLSKRGGMRLGSYNNSDILFYKNDEVTWCYYVAHPVPRRKIKTRI